MPSEPKPCPMCSGTKEVPTRAIQCPGLPLMIRCKTCDGKGWVVYWKSVNGGEGYDPA